MFSNVLAASSFTYGARNFLAKSSASALSLVPVDFATRLPLMRQRSVHMPVFSSWRPPSPLLRRRRVSLARSLLSLGSPSSPAEADPSPPSVAAADLIECASPDCSIATVDGRSSGLTSQFTFSPPLADWSIVTGELLPCWSIVTVWHSGDCTIATSDPPVASSTLLAWFSSFLILHSVTYLFRLLHQKRRPKALLPSKRRI